MEQLKLKDLYSACKKLMREGHGEKSLIVAGDNEGNFFHGMFYGLTVITPDSENCYEGLIGDNAEFNLQNIIVVG